MGKCQFPQAHRCKQTRGWGCFFSRKNSNQKIEQKKKQNPPVSLTTSNAYTDFMFFMCILFESQKALQFWSSINNVFFFFVLVFARLVLRTRLLAGGRTPSWCWFPCCWLASCWLHFWLLVTTSKLTARTPKESDWWVLRRQCCCHRCQKYEVAKKSECVSENMLLMRKEQKYEQTVWFLALLTRPMVRKLGHKFQGPYW